MYVVAAGFASQETALSRVRVRPDLVVLFSTIPQTFSSLFLLGLERVICYCTPG
jgi:hypothetical protein